jgi:ubiquinone/menaquinone biosynthesis C-methylase UbiE
MHSEINFGYPWQVNYGHLIIAAVALAVWVLGWYRKWPKLLLAAIGVFTIWAGLAFVAVRFGFNMNGRATLPTQSFMASGTGKVLDMGAGSGRSALMVLEARPNVTLVALDSFSNSYVQHFGNDPNGATPLDAGKARLISNFKLAGVDQRATIQPGDMRSMPFGPATFDGVVSAYAIDHLDSKGAASALSEAFRVLKPGGEFLLMVLHKDFWINLAFGPLAMHSHMPDQAQWIQRLRTAGFDVLETGTQPASLYFLSRKH